MDYKNNPYLRNFYFSSATFSEYKVTLDIRYINTIEDIIQDCKENLLNTLKVDVNLYDLTYEELLQYKIRKLLRFIIYILRLYSFECYL